MSVWHEVEKPTGLICSRIDTFDRERLGKTCAGRAGVCSRTLRPHLQLSGRDPVSRKLWTQIAEPYPRNLSESLAYALLGDWRVKCTGVS